VTQAPEKPKHQPAELEARRICLLVLGAHRSGTSALTRLLDIHGCDLPATLMGPNFGNDDGHWESDAITSLDFDCSARAGSILLQAKRLGLPAKENA
jgi:hypothetical protein